MLIMNEAIKEIRELLDKNCLDKAEKLICDKIEADASAAELFYLKGQIYMKRQEWGNAINAFNQVLEIDPDYPGAQNQIEMARSILGFFNPDLINP